MPDRLHSAKHFRELLADAAADQSPYVFESIFSDENGAARRLSKRKFKLLKQIDSAVRTMLRPNERVLFVTEGITVSFWESYFLGWAMYLLNRRAILVTSERMLLIQISSSGAPRELRAQIAYEAVDELKVTVFGSVKLRYRDGSTTVLSKVPRADRRVLKQTVDAVAAGLEGTGPGAEGWEDLCPHCYEPTDRGLAACPACRRAFKSPAKAGLLSLLFPGFGDLYIGHRGFAVLEILVAAVFWLGALLLAADPTLGVSDAIFFVAIVLVLIHGTDAVATWVIARKGVHPEHGASPGAGRFLAAGLPLALVLLGIAIPGAAKRGLAPPLTAVPGSALTPRHLEALRSAGVMRPDDEIEYFYSNGPGTLLRDVNFFTPERVVSYARDLDSVFHESVALADVVDLHVEYSATMEAVTAVVVIPEQGNIFYLIVSPRDGGDTAFVTALTDRWRSVRKRVGVGIWYDGGPGETPDDPIVIRGATRRQIATAQRDFLRRWLGPEGEEWSFVSREAMVFEGRRIERVTVELPDGETERYHFDVSEAGR